MLAEAANTSSIVTRHCASPTANEAARPRRPRGRVVLLGAVLEPPRYLLQTSLDIFLDYPSDAESIIQLQIRPEI